MDNDLVNWLAEHWKASTIGPLLVVGVALLLRQARLFILKVKAQKANQAAVPPPASVAEPVLCGEKPPVPLPVSKADVRDLKDKIAALLAGTGYHVILVVVARAEAQNPPTVLA